MWGRPWGLINANESNSAYPRAHRSPSLDSVALCVTGYFSAKRSISTGNSHIMLHMKTKNTGGWLIFYFEIFFFFFFSGNQFIAYRSLGA